MAKGSPFPAEHKGLLDRALSLFTDVRAGEGVGALLLATNVFYLLAFYQVLKIVRDALILSESGAVAASYASAGMAAVLFVFVPAYGALASRVNRVWLISGGHDLLRVASADLLRARFCRCAHRRGVLHLGRRVQHGGGRPVLGVCQRPLHDRAREAIVPAGRHRRITRRARRRGTHGVLLQRHGPVHA